MRPSLIPACLVLALMATLAAPVAAQEDPLPWWEAYPRVVETNNLASFEARNGSLSMNAGRQDPGWGPFGQEVLENPYARQDFSQAGYRSIGYFETYGDSYCFLGELTYSPFSGHYLCNVHHWNWQLYSGGTYRWIGPHSFFDDEPLARPYTRSHPRYGGPPMTYPDATVATGYDGDPADPRNHRVYDAGCSKDILGNPSHFAGYNPTINAIDPGDGLPVGPLDGTVYIPEDDQYASFFSMFKDTACPLWNDYHHAMVLAAVERGGIDGMWSDNFSAWDSFSVRPVMAGFGEWSVARFRNFLADNFTPAELNALGIANPANFDIRLYLRQKVQTLGGNAGNLYDVHWSHSQWLEDPIWNAYKVFKRQAGTEALENYYDTVKQAAALGGKPEFLIMGNDIPVFSLGWPRGKLDMVSTEVSLSWNLCAGARGFLPPPTGRLAPFYRLAREHAQSRLVNVWLYHEGYETELADPELAELLYYEMLATDCLPMLHPENPKQAQHPASEAEFFDFVAQCSPRFTGRQALAEVGVVYSSASVLQTITPGGYLVHDAQYHQFAHWGWATALGQLHHQYRPLPEWKLTSATLEGLEVLILPQVESLDAELVSEVIEPWLRAGGGLIVTGSSGMREGEEAYFALRTSSSLAPLTGEPNPSAGPPSKTLSVGAGTLRFLSGTPGYDYYQNETLRPVLLAGLAEDIQLAWPDGQAPLLHHKQGLDETIAISLYRQPETGGLILDCNNLAYAAAGGIQPAGPFSFRIDPPAWFDTTDFRRRLLSPDPDAGASATPLPDGSIEIAFDRLDRYAALLLEPADPAGAGGWTLYH